MESLLIAPLIIISLIVFAPTVLSAMFMIINLDSKPLDTEAGVVYDYSVINH